MIGAANTDGTPPPPFKEPRYVVTSCEMCGQCWLDMKTKGPRCIYGGPFRKTEKERTDGNNA